MPENLIERYLTDMGEVRGTGSNVAETSFYPALERLLSDIGKGLSPKVRCVINLANRGAGLPDGGLFSADQFRRKTHDADAKENPFLVQNPSRGVIEAKPPSEDVRRVAGTEQVERYWKRYGMVLVTNFRAFALIGKGPTGQPCVLESFTLAESESEFWRLTAHPRQAAAEHGERMLEYLKRVLLHNAPLAAPQDVAGILASYAHDARLRIEQADLPALASLRQALEDALGLRFEGEKGEHFFRSTLIQTLFYGVFSAWVLWARRRDAKANEKTGFADALRETAAPYAVAGGFDWRSAHYLLRVPMLRALFVQVADPARLGALGLIEVLDWTAAALNRVDRAEFFKSFDEGHAVQYFYEPFLHAFDPELRKELGVWYTPEEIVRYQVARVDAVLRSELGLADGLADPNVVVLDPCCGTGAYLLAVLRRIAATLQDKGGDALVANDLKKAAMERVFGFEILPAPFVIAHLQLGPRARNPRRAAERPQRSARTRRRLSDQRPDRLGAAQGKAETDRLPRFRRRTRRRRPGEAGKAHPRHPRQPALQRLRRRQSGGRARAGRTVQEGPHLRVGHQEVQPGRPLRPLLPPGRAAHRRMTAAGASCRSSRTSPTWAIRRSSSCASGSWPSSTRIWFDCMNGDSRETGKLTPEGKPDPSVFSTECNREGIRVGTAIGLFVKRGRDRENETAVRFRHFWGTTKRADLLASLDAKDFDAQYETSNPRKDNRWSFRPSDVTSAYLGWPRLTELCARPPSQRLWRRRGKALIGIDRSVSSDANARYFDEISVE